VVVALVVLAAILAVKSVVLAQSVLSGLAVLVDPHHSHRLT